MTIHLIKSSEVSADVFTSVYDLLTATDGTLQFKCDQKSIINFDEEELYDKNYIDEDSFIKKEAPPLSNISKLPSDFKFPVKLKTASWGTIFKKCETYRKKYSIPKDEIVILLTDISNNYNWFATLDVEKPNNGFIHTADWDMFLNCHRKFPIAYEVIALLAHRFSFDNSIPVLEQAHKRSIGCINDLCMEKREIILKMRTADICGECMSKLKFNMPMTDILHALSIIDSLRIKMLYAQNFKQHVSLSSVYIDERNHRIFLPDFGNIEIKLRPLEKVLYFLFMRYPEGLYLTDLADHRQELIDFYEKISHTGTLEEMRERINDLVNVLSNSASEKISRIKRVFEEAIGPDLAKHYYIQGGNGERKKINLKMSVDIS